MLIPLLTALHDEISQECIILEKHNDRIVRIDVCYLSGQPVNFWRDCEVAHVLIC